MTVEKIIAHAFTMNEDTWARHANPWSVWTRNTVLPALILGVWSRAWLGWYSFIPVGMALFWMWLNPRVFPIPKSTDHWASKGVLGEKIWLKRKELSIPPRHRVFANVLNAVAAAGIPFLVWGLIRFSIWPTIVGCVFVYTGKLWFLDRMVRLYEEMKVDPGIERGVTKKAKPRG
jgi:hypothetical protein